MTITAYQPPIDRLDSWVEVLGPIAELAKAVGHTDFVPRTIRGNIPAITAAVLYGREVGVMPMQAVNHIAVIDGRPAMSAELMAGLILRAGHELSIEEATNTRATAVGRRRDGDVTRSVTWTMDDAKRAGLAGKDNWRKYPRAMLGHRATAELARSMFADAIGGFAMFEELDDAELATAEPPTSTTTRRRRRALAPVSSPSTSGTEPGPASGEEAGGSEPPHSAEGAAAGNDPAPPPASDTSEPEPELMTDPQRRKMQALFRELGFTEREARLGFAVFHVGRPVESSNDLTIAEASIVIDALERRAEAMSAGTE